MSRTLSIFLSLSFILFSCKNENYKPIVFKTPIKGRLINLEKLEGDKIPLKKSIDKFVNLRFRFNPDNQTNLISLEAGDESIDTLFCGTVTKLREIYLLNNSTTDNFYEITPIKITQDSIFGLIDNLLFQSENYRDVVYKPEFNHIIKDTTNQIVLQSNRKDAKKLFRKIIAKAHGIAIVHHEN